MSDPRIQPQNEPAPDLKKDNSGEEEVKPPISQEVQSTPVLTKEEDKHSENRQEVYVPTENVRSSLRDADQEFVWNQESTPDNTAKMEQYQPPSGGIKRTREQVENLDEWGAPEHQDEPESIFKAAGNPENTNTGSPKSGNKPGPENGCCYSCMKAFSKNNKSCLCQVPKHHRKSKLPVSGCKF